MLWYWPKFKVNRAIGPAECENRRENTNQICIGQTDNKYPVKCKYSRRNGPMLSRLDVCMGICYENNSAYQRLHWYLLAGGKG
jgi:hypothetical protein